ncbi:MAG: htrA 2 [Frankiales bacterium]|nr:htrA 2 [Frankiales bacterium]
MSDHPDTPWWATDGATAVQPSDTPPADPPPAFPPAESEPPRRKRGASAGLLALALVIGGGAGGVVSHQLDSGSTTTVVGGTPVSGTRVIGSASDTVKGTPESAAATIGPSIVTVEVTGQTQSAFGGSEAQSDTGSGIIIRSEGYILTNNHVVSAAAGGGSVHVTLADGSTVPATIVGTDSSADLAVLKITGTNGLKAAVFADSESLKVGQAVLAIGAPLGLSNTVTQGIVSTLHRPVRTGDSSSSQAVIDAVQTDAAINPGNSGGALVDLAGRLVGVNSAIATTGASSTGSQSGNIGVGFAIPSNVAANIADQLIKTGKSVHSQIGVNVEDAPGTTDGAPGLGASIRAVTSGGAAEKAGIQAGDIVIKVDDRIITDADTLIVAIRSHEPGSTVKVTLKRGGTTKTLSVTLGTSDAS